MLYNNSEYCATSVCPCIGVVFYYYEWQWGQTTNSDDVQVALDAVKKTSCAQTKPRAFNAIS